MIDLRTDFISRPTPAMVEAMAVAARTRPEFDSRNDPTVAGLERLAAEMLGKEDALFCPTCTMANQIAIRTACVPGEAFAAEATTHVLTVELASVGPLSGVVPVHVPGRHGAPDLTRLEEALQPGHASGVRVRLVVIENTHVMSGGRVVPLPTLEAISAMARRRGISLHLDGARLFNAAVRLGLDARQLTGVVDTVAVSLNKGLCAPMGAVLAGSRTFIAEAVRVRQMFGGNWRPANIPAAAGIVALSTMVDRLAQDHFHASTLARGLARLDVVQVDPGLVETNIILAHVDPGGTPVDRLVADLKSRGILVLPFGERTVRLCLHREIGAEEISEVLRAFEAVAPVRTARI